MPKIPRSILAVALTAIAAVSLAACGDDDDAASSTSQTTATACQKADLALVTPGTLTVATDSPAFPPYVIDDDPTSGKGFESAVAYAVAEELGFTAEEVKWIRVPFNSTFAPGPKKFDFDLNQVSINAERQAGADFSSPYYTTPQGVLVAGDSEFADATTVTELKDAQIGVQVGTTSLDAVNAVIAPGKQVRVFNDSNDVVRALKNGQVDAIVTDLPTTLYLRDAVVEGSTLVGQFEAPGGDDWGAVLEKDSALTACVSGAIDSLRDSGELAAITEEWIGAEAPVLALE
ncbi:MAG: amino acid ABC transporter substrate-binding protein [Thermoleophilia bacterium]|jgi:polar amino acid transport system substrate-binding protein|nr:amino acid ABC transporter substrate-binding protein [Thermoleophilia bacterium]